MVVHEWTEADWDIVPRGSREHFKERSIEHSDVSDWVNQMFWFINVLIVIVKRPWVSVNLVNKSFVIIKIDSIIHVIVNFHLVTVYSFKLRFFIIISCECLKTICLF